MTLSADDRCRGSWSLEGYSSGLCWPSSSLTCDSKEGAGISFFFVLDGLVFEGYRAQLCFGSSADKFGSFLDSCGFHSCQYRWFGQLYAQIQQEQWYSNWKAFAWGRLSWYSFCISSLFSGDSFIEFVLYLQMEQCSSSLYTEILWFSYWVQLSTVINRFIHSLSLVTEDENGAYFHCQ